VLLDGRLLKTPKRQPMVLPTPVLAHMVAAEWEAQRATLRAHTMPMVRYPVPTVVDASPVAHKDRH
jgi:chaperone required for assembly of F1-ATPase